MSARGRQTTANPIANTTAKAHASICRMPPATNPIAWKARHARNMNGAATSISSASGQAITNKTPSANSTNRSFSIFVDVQPHTLKYEFEARKFPPSTQDVVVPKAIFFRETDSASFREQSRARKGAVESRSDRGPMGWPTRPPLSTAPLRARLCSRKLAASTMSEGAVDFSGAYQPVVQVRLREKRGQPPIFAFH